MPDTGPLRPAPVHGPVFIIGAMGSGSTLLRLILDSHDNIAIPRETGFMRALQRAPVHPLQVVRAQLGQADGLEPARSSTRSCARFYDRIFMRNASARASSAGATRRRTTRGTWTTWRACSRTRCSSAIVRHPGRLRRLEHELAGATRSARPSTTTRATTARSPARRRSDGERFAIVRYEDLVLQPEPVLRELLDWLGEEWSDERARAPHGAGRARRQAQGRGPQPRRRPDRRRRGSASGRRRWTSVSGRSCGGGSSGSARSTATTSTTRRRWTRCARARDRRRAGHRRAHRGTSATSTCAAGTVPVADRFYDPRKVRDPHDRGARRARAARRAELLRAPSLAVWRRLPERVRRPSAAPSRRAPGAQSADDRRLARVASARTGQRRHAAGARRRRRAQPPP